MKEVYINFCMFLFHRFLIFPHMGQSLQSVMEEEDELLSEKVVLQLACRIVSVFQTIFLIFVKNCDSPLHLINVSSSLQLDVLQYIHSNEYVHADINAENIYIKPGQKSQVRNIQTVMSQCL